LLLKVEQSFCVIAKVTITSINAHRVSALLKPLLTFYWSML